MSHTGDDQHAAPAAYGGGHDAEVIGDPLTMKCPGECEGLVPGDGDTTELDETLLVHHILPECQGDQLRGN